MRARRSTKEKGGLFAPGVTIVALGGIRVRASDCDLCVGALPDGVAVEVIHGLAVPGTIGGGDNGEQAGSDAVGTGHEGLLGRLRDIFVCTADEDGAGQSAENKQAQQSLCQRLSMRTCAWVP